MPRVVRGDRGIPAGSSAHDGYVQGGAQAAGTTDFPRNSPSGPLIPSHPSATCTSGELHPDLLPGWVSEYGEDFDSSTPARRARTSAIRSSAQETAFAITDDSEATRVFMEYPEGRRSAHEIWMAQSGFLTPYTQAIAPCSATNSLRAVNELSCSRRQPAASMHPTINARRVGAGAYWSGHGRFSSTGEKAGDVARTVQERWASIQLGEVDKPIRLLFIVRSSCGLAAEGKAGDPTLGGHDHAWSAGRARVGYF